MMRLVKVWSSAIFATLFMAASVFGQDAVSVGTASGAAGSDVTVEVNATSAVALSAVEVTLSFDQTVLQIKSLDDDGVTQGAASSAWTFALLGDQDITDANSSGEITISLLTFSGTDFVDAGSDLNLIDIMFTISESAAEGATDVEITAVSLVDDQGTDLTDISTTNGSVTVTAGGSGGGDNKIWVTDASGAANGSSTLKVRADSDTDIHAIQFDLLFDQTTLQIASNGVSLGNDTKALSLPVIDADAITAANTDGKLVVYMLDLNSDPTTTLGKLSSGTNLELLSVRFSISADAALGEQTISLANVSMVNVSQDTVTTEIDFMAEDGTLTISEFTPGDVSGDGVTNIFDLLDLLKALKGQPTNGPSDVNGDGTTNIFDLLALLKLI